MKKIKRIFWCLLCSCLLLGMIATVVPQASIVKEVSASNVYLNKTKLILISGTKYTLKLNIPSSQRKNVKWESQYKNIVTVNQNGEVVARNTGIAKIRATYGGKKYFCTIKVENPKMNKTKLFLTPGQKDKLVVNGTKQKVTWASSNPQIVSCDRYGEIRALTPGVVKIRAIVGSKKLFCTVEVKKSSSGNEKPTTPFPWKRYPVMAHALGAINGQVYLNSKESFIESYNKGYRLFEVDLAQTSDGVWVCRHNWKESLGQWNGSGTKVLSSKEFLSTPIYGKCTPMSLKDLFVLLKNYPDAYVLFDSKKYATRNYSNTLADYSQYLKIAYGVGAESVLKRIVPQIYNESMYSALEYLDVFPNYLYSLWKDYSMNELIRVADFCQKNKIFGVSISRSNWSKESQRLFDKKNISLYVYTVNNLSEAKRYIEEGAAGICTDMITKNDLGY